MRRAFILLVFLSILAVAAWIAFTLYNPYQGFEAPGVFVEIPKGSSARTIARILADQGVVRSQWTFALLCRTRSNRRLQAGEYYFDHPQTAFNVFDMLAAGKVFELTVTVPEGYNIMQIADLLAEGKLVSREDFLAAAHDTTPIRDLAPTAPSVEGFLFPATYEFPRHITSAKIIAEMTQHFRTEWSALTAATPLANGRAVQNIVTLASLVESETPKMEERPIIAGVFQNRLRIGMALACDPTVVYALEQGGAYDGTLTSADMHVDSPYNTYRNRGLPPGPIANPGEASLRAALQPATVDYLYFVADTEGGHFFSKSFAEHIRNIARYHQLLAQKNAKEPAQKRP
ncbi:MAG TPA: endolytic transglycosylase MltG [Candidatus Acidoferrales bacterium]|nr:endolytic transglycosylase MltG [Candidatus Acidoferrales bacterium]